MSKKVKKIKKIIVNTLLFLVLAALYTGVYWLVDGKYSKISLFENYTIPSLGVLFILTSARILIPSKKGYVVVCGLVLYIINVIFVVSFSATSNNLIIREIWGEEVSEVIFQHLDDVVITEDIVKSDFVTFKENDKEININIFDDTIEVSIVEYSIKNLILVKERSLKSFKFKRVDINKILNYPGVKNYFLEQRANS